MVRGLRLGGVSLLGQQQPLTQEQWRSSFMRRNRDPQLNERVHRVRALQSTLKVSRGRTGGWRWARRLAGLDVQMSSPLWLGRGPGRVLGSRGQALDFEDGGWSWLGSGRWAPELALGSGSAPSRGDPAPLTPTPLPGKAAGATGSGGSAGRPRAHGREIPPVEGAEPGALLGGPGGLGRGAGRGRLPSPELRPQGTVFPPATL